MKKKTKSRLANFLFFLVCVPACFVCLWLFWRDLNKTSVRNDKTQIASIYFKRRVAQRKYSDRVVWERLAQSSPLYDKDILRVAKEAQARIKFKNKAELSIDENTMLQIFGNKDGSVSINLSGGDVTIDATSVDDGSKISLLMDDGSEMKFSSGSKISAAKSSSGENTFQIQSGSAVIEKNGNSETFETGSAVKINSDGELELKPVCVTSVGKNFELLKFEGEKDNSVILKWITEASQKNSPVRVETSYDSDFSEIEQSFELVGDNSVQIKNPEKNLYWRVYALENEDEAESGKITVEKIPDVELLSPVKNPVFEYRKSLPKIQFSWKGNDFASFYQFSVFRSDDLSKPLVSEKVYDENISVNSLGEGDYLWKVSPFYEIDEIGEGKPTEMEMFYVSKSSQIFPAKLEIPLENAKIALEDSSSKISFSWKSDVEESSYDFIISDSEDFSNIVYESQTEKTQLIQKIDDFNLSEGKYFWKVVRSSDADTEETKESQVRSFTVGKVDKSAAKLLYPPESFSVEKQRLELLSFVWRPGKNQNESENPNGPDENKTTIQFSNQDDFSQISFEKVCDGNEASKISLESGKWFWRVKTAEGDASLANSLFVLEKLEPPEISSPANGSSVILPSSNLLSIKWKEESDADYFKVKLIDSFGTNIIEENLPAQNHETKFTLPNLERQNYKSFKVSLQTVKMATELSEMRISEKTEINFSAKNPENLVLVSPRENSEIEGLYAEKNPVRFVWSENDKIAENSSSFVLRKLSANGSWRTVERIANPGKEISVQKLAPGKYQWTVEAAGFNGINLSAENPSYFTVTEIPHLSLPVLVSPENNFVIGADYLKRNRSIIFRWNEVEGATDYVFALYQKTENGGLKKIAEKRTKENSFKFRNLRKLDIASFEWQVTAYLYGKDNVEERNSETAGSLFTINFDLPQKIQTIEPGTQYGE